MCALGFELREEAVLRTLTQDVLKTSEIEGERLDAEEVRSSLARRLGLPSGGSSRCCSAIWSARPRCRSGSTRRTCRRPCAPIRTPWQVQPEPAGEIFAFFRPLREA
jgi:Domain of unknown function (DUF4172)